MQKRIAAIHDLSCFGKCSLTVALPVISAFGIECAVLPTAMLSGHFAALPEVSVLDLTERMGMIADQWKQGGVTFDGIFSGYLSSREQVEQVEKFVKLFKEEHTLFVADPAMADRGRLYRGFGMDHVEAMKKLCMGADVVLPNVTEACLMLGKEFREQQEESYIRELLQGMTELGPKQVVITGVSLTSEQVGIACMDHGAVSILQRTKTPGHYNGTGDLFASVFTAAAVKGVEFSKAAKLAMDFTAKVIAETAKNPHHRTYGVDFEQHLKELPVLP